MPHKDPQYFAIEDIRAPILSVKDGRILLDTVDAAGVGTYYDQWMPDGCAAYTTSEVDPRYPHGTRVMLNPAHCFTQQVSDAIHEYHHIVEGAVVTSPMTLLSEPSAGLPKLDLFMALTRVFEGATYVFEAKLGRQIAEATGLEMKSLLSGNGPDAEWPALFESFQASAEAKTYDTDCLNHYEGMIKRAQRLFGLGIPQDPGPVVARGGLRELFRISSHDAAGDLSLITRTGLDKDAPNYLPYRNNSELIGSVLSHVDPTLLERAREMTP